MTSTYSMLPFQTPNIVEGNRHEATTEEKMQQYYAALAHVIANKDTPIHKDLVFNMDESMVELSTSTVSESLLLNRNHCIIIYLII